MDYPPCICEKKRKGWFLLWADQTRSNDSPGFWSKRELCWRIFLLDQKNGPKKDRKMGQKRDFLAPKFQRAAAFPQVLVERGCPLCVNVWVKWGKTDSNAFLYSSSSVVKYPCSHFEPQKKGSNLGQRGHGSQAAKAEDTFLRGSWCLEVALDAEISQRTLHCDISALWHCDKNVVLIQECDLLGH